MYSNKLQLVNDDIFAYLIIRHGEHETVTGNNLAQRYYADENKFPLLTDMFPNLQLDMNQKEQFLLDEKSVKASGEVFSCDLEIYRPEPTLLFFVIKEKIQESDLYLTELVELSDNPVFVLNLEDNYRVAFGNERFFQFIRMNQEEFEQKHQSSFPTLLEENSHFNQTIERILKDSNECEFDLEFSFDKEFYFLFRFDAFRAQDNRLYGVLVSIKRQSELMKKIEYDQQYFDIMQEFSKDLLFRIDINKKTLVHRGDISNFVGLLPEMKNFPESMRDIRLIHPDDLEGYIAFIYRMIHGTPAVYEPRFLFTNGEYERYRLQGKPLFDSDGVPVQVVGKSENIQKYIEIEKKANYDSLTTALNKQSFRELIEETLRRAVQTDKFALLFLDFDDFKNANDVMGHAFGDFLLETAGKRIINCVRNHDKVGRVGGDEFVVFFPHAPHEAAVLERAESILHSLRRPFNNGDQRYSIKASIGIALYPDHGGTYDELYRRADKALYESKSRGKDVATIYFSDLDL
ncbi:MAG: sensor domain-containing diguanylate cyclase [Eubacteriales bacterium]